MVNSRSMYNANSIQSDFTNKEEQTRKQTNLYYTSTVGAYIHDRATIMHKNTKNMLIFR